MNMSVDIGAEVVTQQTSAHTEKGETMSRLSTAEEFKAANEKLMETIGELGDTDLITNTSIALATDTLLRCLLLLAEIADMMEGRNDATLH